MYWKLGERSSLFVIKWQRAWLNCVHIHPRILWKTEFVNGNIGYLAEAISKQSVEGATWLLFNSHSKMRDKKNGLKLLLKRKQKLKIWKILSSSIWQKKKKPKNKQNNNNQESMFE